MTNRTLKRTLILIFMAMALSSLSSASIYCGAAQTLSDIIAGGGCSFGSNTFTNVSLAGSTTAGGAPAGAIDPTQVTLQAALVGSNLLNVVITNLTPSNWALSGSQQFTLVLSYTLTGALPAYFLAVGDSFNGSGTSNSNGTGGVSFDKTADSTTLLTLSLAMMSQAPVGFAGAPLQTFNVTDNLQVHATNASATLVDATNSFVVPEPVTSMLLGSSLLALGFMLRRKRK